MVRQLGKYMGLHVTQYVQGGSYQLRGSDNSFRRSNNGFRQRRCRRRRVDGGVGVVSCNAMNAEHRLRQRIGVLSGGGADARITVK